MEDENSEYLLMRASKLGFKPEKENVYNRLLPYADEMDEEAVRELNLIKTNLVQCLSALELKPGFYLWSIRFEQFMKQYGLMFSKEDHIKFIKLYLEVVKIKKQESMCLAKWCDVLAQLLKKHYLLSRSELEIQWKPLYELYLRVQENSKTHIGFSRHQALLDKYVTNLIKHCRIYFPANSTREILKECKPKMCPFQDVDIIEGFKILQVFLPLCVSESEASISYELWFDEFMAFWESCSDENFIENAMMSLIARLSANNIGRIDFERFFPLMYARFTRSFQFPVHYKMRANSKTHTINIRPVALWIVSTLKSEASFEYLRKFMQMIRSFLYSANLGRWTLKLNELLNKLSLYFVNRVYFERYKKRCWEKEVPEEFRLSDDEIDNFVLILRPCLELAMFSRAISNDVSRTFQHLASLRPSLIIPLALEKLYNSLESLTEPHKLISAMIAGVAVSRLMVSGARFNYPEGPTHIIPLLTAVLPGIDPNDSRKCILTFNFITQFVCMVPLINSSEAGKYHQLTEEEHLICDASSGFEDFVIQFFDRIFIWVESSSLEFIRPEQQNNDGTPLTGLEFMSEHAMSSVITVILRQCSPEIFQAALRKVFNFISSNVLEIDVAGRLAAFLCGAFTKINPKASLKLFIPYLCDKIEELLDEHSKNEEHLDGEILYNLLILSVIVDARNEILNYSERLIKILDATLHFSCIQATKISNHLLTLLLSTLVSIVPTECKSSGECYSKHVSEFLSIREWGLSMQAKELNISWYKPGENEYKMVQFLIYRYLLPELEKLKEYSSKNLDFSRVQLRNSLKIVNAFMVCHSVFPMWNEEPIKLFESVVTFPTFQTFETKVFSVKMPDGSNIRKTIADILHRVQKRLLETDEGDTKSIFVLTNILYTLMFNKVQVLDLETNWKNFTIMKKINENRLLDRKKHLRHILIDRCTLQQVQRLEASSYVFTKTHHQILLDLFELGVSRYRDVRVYSQSKLIPLINQFPYSYRLLKDKLKEILQSDSETNHEQFKGALFILYFPRKSSIIIKQDWKFLSEIWPIIVNSKPSEKPSIIDLISNISDSVFSNFQTPSISYEFHEDFERNLREIYPNFKANPNNSNENEDNYNLLVNQLLECCENRNLHWRYNLLSTGFLRDVVHSDVKYNGNVVKYFLNALINDSILIRKIAIRVVVFILIQQKFKFKKIVVDTKKEVTPGFREDNDWLLYKIENLPKNSKEWEQPKFSHNVSEGYYAWPKIYQIYAPSNSQPKFDENSTTFEQKEIHKFFTSHENIKKLIYYFSLEDKKGSDRFDNNKALIFKYLAKLLNTKILDILLPHLEKLSGEKCESSQRCAAEILSGLIRGSKHWNYEQSQHLWFNIIPIFQTANQNILNETIQDWRISICIALNSRDSRKLHWFLEYLLDDPLSDPTSLISSVKLSFLSNAILQQPWKNAELNQRLYNYLKRFMSHPFQLIRTQISNSLKIIFMRDYSPPNSITRDKNPKISTFFEEHLPNLTWLYHDTLDKINLDKSNIEESKRETCLNLFKIVCKFATSSLVCRSNLHIPVEFYKLLPVTCVLQSNDVDEEIAPLCMNLLALLAESVVVEWKIREILDIFNEVLKCPLWSARAALVEFLSTFVFHNMLILTSRHEWVGEIQKFSLVLLEDHQVEVRENACKFLSGLLHCNFIPEPLNLLENFKGKAKIRVKKSKLTISDNNSVGRHAGVLGLCAFINACPYDVPEFLPDIFGVLGTHLSDPQPIPGTIRKTLCEFKRTHQDNWEVHKMQFTDEQMLVFRDLTVPPSYYV